MIGTTKTCSFASAACSASAWPQAVARSAPDAADALQGIAGEAHGLFQLLGRLDPRDDDAVGTDVEHALDERRR